MRSIMSLSVFAYLKICVSSLIPAAVKGSRSSQMSALCVRHGGNQWNRVRGVNSSSKKKKTLLSWCLRMTLGYMEKKKRKKEKEIPKKQTKLKKKHLQSRQVSNSCTTGKCMLFRNVCRQNVVFRANVKPVLQHSLCSYLHIGLIWLNRAAAASSMLK